MSAAPMYVCIELVEDVTAYLEGRLPAENVAVVDAHLELCPHCREYLDEMRRTITISGSIAAATFDTLAPETRDALLRAFRAARSAGSG